MIIKQMAVGNNVEAFVSCKFSNGKNLIYSNDNNKGKTIILQSIVYALGTDPLFPKGFDYANYSYYLEIEHAGISTYIYRFKDKYMILHKGEIVSFDDESSFKKWFDLNIFALPKIIKDDKVIICDFELFTKIFYLSQDRRDTSSLSSSYFKKDDLVNMIYSMSGCSNIEIDNTYNENVKKRKELLKEKSSLIRKTMLLKTYSKEANTVFDIADKEQLEESLELVEKINTEISNLKRRRTLLYSRLSKNNNTISEITSLRKNIEDGKFVCGDCGSTNIKYYFDKDISFDVSNDEMRRNIVSNLKNTIEIIEREIFEIDTELEIKQSQLKDAIKGDSVNPIDLIILKPDIINDLNYDERLKEIRIKVNEIDELLKEYVSKLEINKGAQKDLDNKLKNKITEIYCQLEDSQNEQIDSLFTKGSELYSGSESTIFLISRLLAFQDVLKHSYPLIIDGYREGEVSSPAERRVIDYLLKTPNQSIVTATFKDEEYHKYDNNGLIFRIDLSSVESKHLLSPNYVSVFNELLAKFCF